MTRPKTAFEVYLEQHPEQTEGNTNKPVLFFEPNTERPGMRDFRVKQVGVDQPDPVGYNQFSPGGKSDPKDSSVMESVPTSPGPPESPKELIVPVERELVEQANPVNPVTRPMTVGPKAPPGKNAKI